MDVWMSKVKEKVKNKIKSLKKKLNQIYNTSPVWQDKEVRQYP